MRLFIQSSAEEDALRQVEWYVGQGLPGIARRFRTAIPEAIDALFAMPGAGTPRHIANPHLAGLRTWPVKGFDEFRVYYVAHPDLVCVIRILHSKRDVGAILQGQQVEDLGSH